MSKIIKDSSQPLDLQGGEHKDNKHLEFNTQIGTKAIVERHSIGGELTEKTTRELQAIGAALKPEKGLDYLGSIAVHIYKSEALELLAFAEQTAALGGTPEVVAIRAIETLAGRTQEYYGRKAQERRSGF